MDSNQARVRGPSRLGYPLRRGLAPRVLHSRYHCAISAAGGAAASRMRV